MQAEHGEHGGEKGFLILAVAVLIGKNVFGAMRLVAADAEGHADVADLRRGEGVDGADLVLFGRFAGG